MRWFLIPNNHITKSFLAISIIHSTRAQSWLKMILLNSQRQKVVWWVTWGLGGEWGVTAQWVQASFWNLIKCFGIRGGGCTIL